MTSKDEDDSYLSGLILATPVQRRRSRIVVPSNNDSDQVDEYQNQPGTLHIATFKYKTQLPVEVCAKALLSVFGVSEMKIRRIRNSLAMAGVYTKRLNKKKMYLPSELNITKMYNMFNIQSFVFCLLSNVSHLNQYFHFLIKMN